MDRLENPTAVVRDEEGDQIAVRQGGAPHLSVVDELTHDLLREVLLELKILNRHLALMNDEELKAEDTQCR